MPGWFGEMDRRMRFYDRICSAGVLFPGDRRGHISGGKLDFKLEESDLDLLRRAASTLTKVHFAAGALEVWPALLKGQTLYPGMRSTAFSPRPSGPRAISPCPLRTPMAAIPSISIPRKGWSISIAACMEPAMFW
jgi:hypothetical protein